MKQYSWDYTQNKLKEYNMEEKKKFDWKKVWAIVRDFILALLTADSIRNL